MKWKITAMFETTNEIKTGVSKGHTGHTQYPLDTLNNDSKNLEVLWTIFESYGPVQMRATLLVSMSNVFLFFVKIG